METSVELSELEKDFGFDSSTSIELVLQSFLIDIVLIISLGTKYTEDMG